MIRSLTHDRPTIETDSGKILERIEQKLDRVGEDVTEIKVEQARLEERMTAVEGEAKGLKDEIKDLSTSQRNQIWVLIGILGMVALGAVVRLVLPVGNP
ncbi:MAG: hypothetical protein ACKO1I_02515 [Microcystis aeruginosa]